MDIITINKKNIDSEHICCAIGNDKKNKERAQSKKDWMKEQFMNGLVFKRIDERGKFFIEYMPVEKVWKPIKGKNYLIINCLWVSGRFKEKGIASRLLEECVEHAKNEKLDGVAVVSSKKKKPFLTDKSFFIKYGFKVIDAAPPYFELLGLNLNTGAESPSFSRQAKMGVCDNNKGFTFIYSNQCPFMEEYIALLDEICRDKEIPSKTIKLKDFNAAQKLGSPFGTLGIYYQGEFKTHELMSEKKFEKFIQTVV